MRDSLLEINLTCSPYPNAFNYLLKMAQLHSSAYCCIANVHMLIEAHRDPGFAVVVNAADIVTPDGMPLVWGLKLLYGIHQERIAGMDLLPDLLSAAEKENLTVFFYGGTEDMLQKTHAYLGKHYPQLQNKHYYSPPFRLLAPAEEAEVVNRINATKPHLVFVALGCPKQEKWMAAMKGRIHACMIGIGGALPVMIGMQKRAPKWMQNAGLEWLFRLVQEPGRLFKRYAVTNTVFLWLLFKAWARQGFRARKPKLEQVSS